MPRQPHPWFRCYVEMITDRKVRRLDMTQRWVWVAVLAAAGDSHVRGQLLVAEGVPMTAAELAEFAGVKERDVARTLELTTALGMTTVDAGGLVTVTNWHKRQFESDLVTKRTRQAKERSKQRSQEQPKEQPADVPGNGRRNGTETENRNRQNEVDRGGDRNETLRASPATEPPACSKHPHGDHDGPCAGCAKVREWWQRHDGLERQRQVEHARNCPDCGGTGWLEHADTGLPAARCGHDRTRRTA